uniref:Uncharacterized protein n=1 Tax=Pithovirus LCPAC201 TaxID=2506591 RepID=A0A481Z6L1_9VIRU|nr:MAG: uncharacterized protein LCPAC201_00700 [Pithovirus LCPAC201]
MMGTRGDYSTPYVVPPVVSPPRNLISPVVVTPRTTVVTPGSLSRLPSVNQSILSDVNRRVSAPVVTPGALGQIAGFGSTVTTPTIISSTPTVLQPVAMREKTIEEKLAEKGYIVIDKIFVQDAVGILPQYFKAKNNFGQTVFIELDTVGDVVYENESQTMIVTQNASMVPVSKQIGTYECSMSGGACGVAFDCDGEICTLIKSIDSPDQPTRLILTTASRPQTKSLTLSDSPTAYTVVRLSDILADPLATAGIIEKSTSSIRNAGYQECKENWNDFEKATSEMKMSATEFSSTSSMILDRLASDLRTLNNFRAAYVKSPPTTEEAKEKYQSVVYNIDNRQELLVALFAICQAIPTSTQVIKEQGVALKESAQDLRNIFQNLGTVVSGSTIPKVSQTI